MEKRRDNRYEVEFKNVTFRYPDTQVNVLENLSCRFCDEILVFDQGKVVQQGDHETLAADADGLYYKLWQAQAKYYH